jgi:cold shock CspA family protein/ribosome-associated translation inhibitor RaiA
MQLEMHVSARNVALGPADEEMIREAAAKLDGLDPRLTGCRVIVSSPHRRTRTGGKYQVEIELLAPGGQFVVRRQSDENLMTAIQTSFAAARRRLQDQARRRRGQVKSLSAMPRGTVTKLLPGEGYGFVTTGDGREIYFDRAAVVEDRFDRLTEGDDVRFVEAEGEGEKGPQASTVVPVRRGRPRRR